MTGGRGKNTCDNGTIKYCLHKTCTVLRKPDMCA